MPDVLTENSGALYKAKCITYQTVRKIYVQMSFSRIPHISITVDFSGLFFERVHTPSLNILQVNTIMYVPCSGNTQPQYVSNATKKIKHVPYQNKHHTFNL